MLFNILIGLMAVAVLLGALCRLDPFSPKRHKIWWGVMYACCASFAGAAALGQVDEAMFFGLASWSLNFLLTKHMWAEGPPTNVEKPNA